MTIAPITSTNDLKYKGGYVQCACGWRKELGDGFDGYHIANCPKCTPDLETRIQRKVTTGRHPNLTVKVGSFVYFAISNGIHVQYSGVAHQTHTGLSTQKANRIS